MAGHSHWAGIKHKKAIQDAKRASIFTKAAKLITIAAKEGGDNPDTNLKLRLAIDQARSINMPKANIDRAIKRGTGKLKEGAEIEEVIYEALSPQGISMLIKTATDNRNRTVAELKAIFNKMGGKLVPPGSFKYLFRQAGVIYIDMAKNKLGDIELKVIEAGADDIETAANLMQVYVRVNNLYQVKDEIEKRGIIIKNAGLIFIPSVKMSVKQKDKLDYERFLEKLDELDDVQEIYDNL